MDAAQKLRRELAVDAYPHHSNLSEREKAAALSAVRSHRAQPPCSKARVPHRAHWACAHGQFHGNAAACVCATSGFGMGVDKREVRTVILWGAVPSKVTYYQQVRARMGPRSTDVARHLLTRARRAHARVRMPAHQTGRAGRDHAAALCSTYFSIAGFHALLYVLKSDVVSRASRVKCWRQ